MNGAIVHIPLRELPPGQEEGASWGRLLSLGEQARLRETATRAGFVPSHIPGDTAERPHPRRWPPVPCPTCNTPDEPAVTVVGITDAEQGPCSWCDSLADRHVVLSIREGETAAWVPVEHISVCLYHQKKACRALRGQGATGLYPRPPRVPFKAPSVPVKRPAMSVPAGYTALCDLLEEATYRPPKGAVYPTAREAGAMRRALAIILAGGYRTAHYQAAWDAVGRARDAVQDGTEVVGTEVLKLVDLFREVHSGH